MNKPSHKPKCKSINWCSFTKFNKICIWIAKPPNMLHEINQWVNIFSKCRIFFQLGNNNSWNKTKSTHKERYHDLLLNRWKLMREEYWNDSACDKINVCLSYIFCSDFEFCIPIHPTQSNRHIIGRPKQKYKVCGLFFDFEIETQILFEHWAYDRYIITNKCAKPGLFGCLCLEFGSRIKCCHSFCWWWFLMIAFLQLSTTTTKSLALLQKKNRLFRIFDTTRGGLYLVEPTWTNVLSVKCQRLFFSFTHR